MKNFLVILVTGSWLLGTTATPTYALSVRDVIRRVETVKPRLPMLQKPQQTPLGWARLTPEQKTRKLDTAKQRILTVVDRADIVLARLEKRPMLRDSVVEVRQFFAVQKTVISNAQTPEEFEQAVRELASYWQGKKAELKKLVI